MLETSGEIGLRDELMLLTVEQWHNKLWENDQVFPETFGFWASSVQECELRRRQRIHKIILEFCPHVSINGHHKLFDATPEYTGGRMGPPDPRWDCSICGESFTSVPKHLHDQF